MKYRIVTNGRWYEIDYKYRFWPFWFRYKPTLHEHISIRGEDSVWVNTGRLCSGYQPINWSNYKFDTIEKAAQRIQYLKTKRETPEWESVIEDPVLNEDGLVTTQGIQESNIRTNVKQPPKYPAMRPKAQAPPAPLSN